ncbi:MAG TPA: tRNA dihydrouridine synthase DusB [Clostridia bacterium]|nr:tRNA dihydrouridine synthase DusB [Clostridia bacterium]
MFYVGDICIKNPVVAAPMAGVTDKAFRILAREAGCGLVCTEMVSDQAILYSNPKTLEMLIIDDETGRQGTPLSVQIFGSDPGYMSQAAKIVESRGADIIDINMGCPTPKIVKNGEGAALMLNPGLAESIIRAVVEAVSVPVTVKMRAGWDENSVNAVDMAKLAEAAGASGVTVHGRTRSQLYSGRADWDIIRSVKKAVDISVVGNGDIFSARDAGRMLEKTGCDGLMIGRASLGNPWIFQQVVTFLATGVTPPPPSRAERINAAIRHLRLLVRFKGEHIAVLEMRKHAAWYIKGLRNAARVREDINKAKNSSTLENLLVQYIKNC